MTETFIALLFAHVAADYVFQNDWMVANKAKPHAIGLHILIVLACTLIAMGRLDAPALYLVALAHLLIDLIKTHLLKDGFAAHIGDQLAHLASLALATMLVPDLWAGGLWASAPSALSHMMVLVAGLILVTRAGGFAVGILMQAHTRNLPDAEEQGLPGGGLTIGLLERGLIFVLILASQPGAIGFLIAAKSILRFGTVAENRAASEYVIIGTLASFGWAIAVSFVILSLRSALPTLEIAPLSP